jgi:hypothetical protein
MCQIRFDSAVWPGARQPCGRSTSEAYGPVSIGIKLFRLSAPPLSSNQHAQTIKNNPYQATACHIDLQRLDLKCYFYFLICRTRGRDPLVLAAVKCSRCMNLIHIFVHFCAFLPLYLPSALPIKRGHCLGFAIGCLATWRETILPVQTPFNRLSIGPDGEY